ncbi:MAG TPA: hypothetical protein VM370_10185, partial [Candidatus Thermoplasmatota archaeon]|nr:hypothetical protein [Candidatus Thermoplasmatota archaeon]
VLPALLVVLLTGLALVVGPYAMVRLAVSRWPQASIALGVILAILLVVGLGGPTKKMLALVDAGEPSGPAMDKLWGEWGTALAAGALLALVATGMMVYQASL